MTPASMTAASLVLLALILSWWAHSLLASRREPVGGAVKPPGTPGIKEVKGVLSVRPMEALAKLVPIEVKDLPTPQYEIIRNYLIHYSSSLYGLRPFPLHVTLTHNIEALLERNQASRGEAIKHGPLSFQADEQEPKITVEVHSEAEALKVVGNNSQTKRLKAQGDTEFTFLLQPVVAEDLSFLVWIKYTRTVLQSAVSKETASVAETVGDTTTTKRTVTDTHKISSQSEEVELAALTLTCSVRSLLGLTGSQLSIVSKLGTFLFTIGLVVVWRLAFPASFNQAQAFGYLVVGLASALGLTIVDPSKVRLPWAPKEEPPEEG